MDKVNLQLENERLKVIIQENEKENQIRISNYDRDKILWENKFNFLLQ
jgi:hypothetical protein